MPRRERLSLVLSSREKAAVEHLAEMEGGLSLAALVRRLIRKEAKDQKLWTEGQGQDRAQEAQTTGAAQERVEA